MPIAFDASLHSSYLSKLFEGAVPARADGNYSVGDIAPHHAQKYLITDTWTNFWLQYCKLANDPENLLTFYEHVDAEMNTLKLDTQLRFNISENINFRITEDALRNFICLVIGEIYNVFEEIFDIRYEANKIAAEKVCCVLRRSDYVDNIVYAGQSISALYCSFSLVFPYIVWSTEAYERYLLPRLIDRLMNNTAVLRFVKTPLDNWTEILRLNKKTRPLYGSTENINRDPYALLSIVDNVAFNYELNSMIGNDILMKDCLSVQESDMAVRNIISVDYFRDDFEEDLLANEEYENSSLGDIITGTKYLPIFLSCNYFKRKVAFREEIITSTPESIVIKKNFGEISAEDEREETKAELAERFLKMMNSHRFFDICFFTAISKALYTIYRGRSIGFETLLKYAQLAVNAELNREVPNTKDFFHLSQLGIEISKSHYYTYYNNGKTLKTLAAFAAEDSKVTYQNWHQNWVHSALSFALIEQAPVYIAMALYRMYWLDFICASIEKRIWYRFVGPHWERSEAATDLRKKIWTVLVKRYREFANEIEAEANNTTETRTETFQRRRVRKMSENETKAESIRLFVKQITQSGMMSAVISEASHHFFNRNFDKFVDADSTLLAIQNGVIASTGSKSQNNLKLTVRKGYPEDYLLSNIGVPYHDHYTWESKAVKEVMHEMDKLQPDVELRDRLLRYSASILRARNIDKVFAIFCGAEGFNGKSAYIRMLEMLLKSKMVKMAIEALSGMNKNASGPSPHLARLKGVLLTVLQESDLNDVLRGSLVKLLTGNDSFFARKNHSDGGDIDPTSKTILVCNVPGILSNPDNALKRRMYFFPFIAVFQEGNNGTWAEQYEKKIFNMDPTFDERISTMLPAFLWILVQYFEAYAEVGIGSHPLADEMLEKYWYEIDIYAQYMGDTLVADPVAFTSFEDLFKSFSAWHAANYPKSQPIHRGVALSSFSSRLGRQANGGWRGWRLIVKAAATDVAPAPLFGGGSTSGTFVPSPFV